MPGLATKPKERESVEILMGDVRLKEVRGQHGHFTGYKEKEGEETVVVDLRVTKGGYLLRIDFLKGGELIQNLRGEELEKFLKGVGFKGEELEKVLREGDLRGATLDRVLKEVDIVRVVDGAEGGANVQFLKEREAVRILKGAMRSNQVNLHETWRTGVPLGRVGNDQLANYISNARAAVEEFIRTSGKSLPDRITPFMLDQAHTI